MIMTVLRTMKMMTILVIMISKLVIVALPAAKTKRSSLLVIIRLAVC